MLLLTIDFYSLRSSHILKVMVTDIKLITIGLNWLLLCWISWIFQQMISMTPGCHNFEPRPYLKSQVGRGFMFAKWCKKSKLLHKIDFFLSQQRRSKVVSTELLQNTSNLVYLKKDSCKCLWIAKTLAFYC